MAGLELLMQKREAVHFHIRHVIYYEMKENLKYKCTRPKLPFIDEIEALWQVNARASC